MNYEFLPLPSLAVEQGSGGRTRFAPVQQWDAYTIPQQTIVASMRDVLSLPWLSRQRQHE